MAAQPSPFASVLASGSESPPVDDRAAFLEALRDTMQATLTAQRPRVDDDIERRRAALVAAVHSRREPVASRIRKLADEEREAIAGWAAAEQLRIEHERLRRTRELGHDLEASLAIHDSRIDEEIQRAEAAIADHRAEVDAFFVALARETDPVAIARLAGERPRFPNIETNVHAILSAPPRIPEPTAPAVDEQVAVPSVDVPGPEPVVPEPVVPEAAEAQEPEPAVVEVAAGPAEAPLVPVMDPIAAKRAAWWAAWKELHEPPELSEVLASVEEEARSREVLEAVTSGQDQADSGIRLESIPILRPFARLRRDHVSDEGASREG
ncbi:MAG TPA: hypothetical protein VFY18_13135 [Candidatus Limnocylindrales bacterium]|nr:hypothetical protein [Candidatus Limnocylindrales bacterium]